MDCWFEFRYRKTFRVLEEEAFVTEFGEKRENPPCLAAPIPVVLALEEQVGSIFCEDARPTLEDLQFVPLDVT